MKELSIFVDESGTQERESRVFTDRDSTYRTFGLAQVADYLCAIELTVAKFEYHCETSTDVKLFGGAGSFKQNWLKQARWKLLG